VAAHRAPLEVISRLRESAESNSISLSEKQAGLLEEVANDQIKAIAAEIAQLESEAARLKDEIAELWMEPGLKSGIVQRRGSLGTGTDDILF
jgi:hypothetical protein